MDDMFIDAKDEAKRRDASSIVAPHALTITTAALSPCLDMAGKVVQYGLPAIALLFDGMSFLTIEGDAHANSFRIIGELDLSRAVTEGILDQLVLHDVCIRSGEVKTHAAVLCFHA